MISEKLKNNSSLLSVSVLLIALFRLLLTATIPLLDKTEARYAEIARIMHETNQWIVPEIDYGVPFWAKPPLSTWLSAASFVVFGVNEFAARFPSFLLSHPSNTTYVQCVSNHKEHALKSQSFGC